MAITPYESLDPKCRRVRDALLSGRFEEVNRKEVNAHLRDHPDCAQWAADLVVITHTLAHIRKKSASADSEQPAAIPQEEAGKAGEPVDRLVAVLDAREFHPLYKAKLAAAPQVQRPHATFQTPDSRLVVTVTYTVRAGQESRPPDNEPRHMIEIAIAARDKKWTESWACYRILDAEGAEVAQDMVQIKAGAAVAAVSLPQTHKKPYEVHVRVLEDEAGGRPGPQPSRPGPSTGIRWS